MASSTTQLQHSGRRERFQKTSLNLHYTQKPKHQQAQAQSQEHTEAKVKDWSVYTDELIREVETAWGKGTQVQTIRTIIKD